MAAAKGQLDSRPSNYLRKYRIFFFFGVTILSVQVYLAYAFFMLENEGRGSTRLASGEGAAPVPEGDEGLPRGSHQLKLPPDKQGSNDNRQAQSFRNRTTGMKLDLNSLNFVPGCEITGREAVSAVTRAQTQLCKQRIVNVTCLSQQGLLYPERLQSSCPHSLGFSDSPKNLGCFKDDKTLRVLSGYYTIFKGENSPELCANLCLQSGYPYAGVEYSIECFCGMEEPSPTRRLPDSSCNMKCPGDPKLSCGGYLTVNVFWTGIQRFKPQEARNSSSSKTGMERPPRIAYLLTVNGRASRQVKRLIAALYQPTHLFYVHVDARQDYMYREMLEVEKKCKANNVRVARGEGLRQASIWGGASLLTTLLTSAQEMLAHPQHWDFLVNLSESDFPVKSDARLADFLTWNKGMNFVKSHGREVQRFITKQGLDKTFVECEARMWRIGDRKLPAGIQIDGGSDWIALSRDFIKYVTDPTPDPLVAGLLRVFQHTLLPAESFFHTVLRNSRFCETYVDNNLHVTNWKRKLGCKCQYRAVVDWCGCSPNDFKSEDFGRIRNTAARNLFFARKFEPAIDQRIIDRVEEWLYPSKANVSSQAKGYDAYWQSMYHHADLSPPADDTLMTVAASLARLTYQRFQVDGNDLGNVKLLEATAYFRANSFTGVLIKCEASTRGFESSTFQNEFPEKVESFVLPRMFFSPSKSWLSRIHSISVSTDYDQKEQTFRNLVGGIGPMSSPVVAYEFRVGSAGPQNISILWVDPNGRLADVNYLQLDEVALTGHTKPQLKEPLVIGTWRLFLMAESVLAAKLSFLVTPLAYWNNQKISMQKARELHNGPSGLYQISDDVKQKWTSFLDNLEVSESRSGFSGTEERVGHELERWIDSMISEYYAVEDTCYAAELPRAKRKLKKCSETSWSSLSPDPKADPQNLC